RACASGGPTSSSAPTARDANARTRTRLILQRQIVVTVVDGRVGGSGMFGPGAVVGVARSTSAGRSARRSRGRGRGWRAGGGSRCCSTGSGRRRRLSGRLWVPLFRRSLVFGGAGGGVVGRGQHGQRDVGVPGSVVADLVLVEPGFVLRGLEALLDRPPGAGDPDQLGD